MMLLVLRRAAPTRALCSQAQRPAFAAAACRRFATAATKEDDTVVKIDEGPLNAAVQRLRLVSRATRATAVRARRALAPRPATSRAKAA